MAPDLDLDFKIPVALGAIKSVHHVNHHMVSCNGRSRVLEFHLISYGDVVDEYSRPYGEAKS